MNKAIVLVAVWGCSSAPAPAPPPPTTTMAAPAAPIDAGLSVDAAARCAKPCMDICCAEGEACSHGNGADGIDAKCIRRRRP